MRSALFWDFTQRRLIVSCRRFGTTVVVKFLQRCWWRFKSSGTFRPVEWSIYLHLQGHQPKMKALRSTETSVTLHQSTGHNLHQHLCDNVMSHRIPTGPTAYDVSLMDLWRSLLHSQKPNTGHIFHSVHYDILKLWLTPISAQFYSFCILSITCRS